jgi:serine/threonine protein kinase
VGHSVFERYRLLRRLSSGGYGKVYLALHEELAKPVAIKLLSHDARHDEDGWEEAVCTARVAHPNVVQIFDAGNEGGWRYLVYELLRGKDLADVQRDAVLAPEQWVHLLVQACRGLGAVHAAGLVHRDVKPRNIFLHDPAPVSHPGSAEPIVKIIDLGLACRKQALPRVAGTPEYMAPEQFFMGPLDERADVFSLGASIYRLVVGRLPYAADGDDRHTANLRARMTQEPRQPRESGSAISPDLEAVIVRAMARAPERRFRDMRELGRALEETPEGRAGWAPKGSARRSISAELAHKKPVVDHLGRTVALLYPDRDGVVIWDPLGANGPRLRVHRDRSVKVDPSFVLHVHRNGKQQSLIVHEDTAWEASVRRRAGAEALDLWLRGGRSTPTGMEIDLGAFGRFHADQAYRGALLGLAAPERDAAAVACLIA